MPEIIPQHAHCHMCGKSIVVGEKLCSEECKKKYDNLLKRRKLIFYFWIGILAAVIAFFIMYKG